MEGKTTSVYCFLLGAAQRTAWNRNLQFPFQAVEAVVTLKAEDALNRCRTPDTMAGGVIPRIPENSTTTTMSPCLPRAGFQSLPLMGIPPKISGSEATLAETPALPDMR